MGTPVKRFIFVQALLLAASLGGAYVDTAQQIGIPPAGISTPPAALVGILFTPASSGLHPAVLTMHGCGGAHDSQGKLGARHRMWGEYLAK